MSQAAADAILATLADAGIQPTGVSADSRQVHSGELFLAWPGHTHDGRSFIDDALARGACAVLWQASDDFDYTPPAGVCALPVEDLPALAGWLASRIYDDPSEKIWLAGITGTNGKTTVSQWLASTLNELKTPCGIIGTLGVFWPDGKSREQANTTPCAPQLQRDLAQLVNDEALAVAIEASSIGIAEGRLNATLFDLVIFTNLSRDHLDYHHSMEAYGAAKARLFDSVESGWAIINADDAFGLQEALRLAALGRQIIAYSCAEHPPAVPGALILQARNLGLAPTGLKFDVHWLGQHNTLQVRMLAPFNVSNLLAVLGALLARGIAFDSALKAVSKLSPPEGRMQLLGGVGEPLAVVDYAHSPDALKNVLQALRPTAATRTGKLICVFGCGGNRDPGKRPQMGRIAADEADEVWLTSDNPRREEADKIIDEIAAGINAASKAAVHRCADREEAVFAAINSACANDIVVVAGKGHEAWQEINDERLPFSDLEKTRAALQDWHQNKAGEDSP